MRLTLDVLIRQATELDLRSLATWSSAATDVFGPSLAAGDHVVLVARPNDGFPIAQMLVALRSAQPGVGVLSHLVVLGGFRNQGIGTAMLEKGQHLLREAGMRASQLSVEKRNGGARRLYERLGYSIIAETTETWPEPAADGRLVPVDHPAWVMQKIL